MPKNLLITYHPETTQEVEKVRNDFELILKALDQLDNTLLIFTNANSDVGGRSVNMMIDEYVDSHPEKSIAFTSLGVKRYLSALQYVDAVVGNSSSGIVEAPSFRIATINIGERQKGRVRASSVVDVDVDSEQILKALEAIYSDDFKAHLKETVNPYGKGDSVQKVIAVLKSVDLDSLKRKPFYDLTIG